MKRRIVQTLFSLCVALSVSGAGVATNWTRPPAAWDSGVYTYDAAGNIVAIGNDAYSYDGAGRLLTATAHTPSHANAQSFTYDRHGNLKQFHPDPKTNRLPNTDYDDAGNQLELDGTYVRYTWDSHGMMTTRTDVGLEERYVYDANDERIVSIRGGNTRLYTLRGLDQKVVREIEHDPAAATWTWKRDYVYRGSTLLASYVASEPGTLPHRHYHVDHLGTPRVVTSSEGYKLALHTYWPFGGEAPGSELDAERLKFTAHERDRAGDPECELDYMHARFYSPGGGRFLSVDPVMDAGAAMLQPQGWNRYSYVRNNPIGYYDPDGRMAIRAYSSRIETEGRPYHYEIRFENRLALVGMGGKSLAGKSLGPFKWLRTGLENANKFLVGKEAVTNRKNIEDVKAVAGWYDTAKFEGRVQDAFAALGPDTVAGSGRYDAAGLVLLQQAVDDVLETMVRDGEITQEEAAKVRAEYDVTRLRDEAEKNSKELPPQSTDEAVDRIVHGN